MKDDKICENYNICRLVNAGDFNIENDNKAEYLKTYCTAGKQKWSACKRFIAKNELGFCPDFVMPDTALTMEEIVDKFDNGEN